MRNFAIVSLIGTCLLSAGVAHASLTSASAAKPNLPKANQPQVHFGMSNQAGGNSNNGNTGSQILSDVLGRERSIGIFGSLMRDVDSVAKKLHDASANITVLAPLDSELTKMSSKPWEDPEDYRAFGANVYEGDEGQSKAQENLRRFVEGHIVLQRPFEAGSKASTLSGTSVSIEKKDGKHFINPGSIEVEAVADKVSNGEVWIIKGVLRQTASQKS